MEPGEIPSNNLWVDNLAPDVTAIDLMSLFQRYGPLDSVTAYSPEGFGFIQFRNINDSKVAKEALHGFFFHGIALKIKFSMPEQELEFRKIRDGQHPNRRIDLPDHPQLMPQDLVKNYSDPIHPGFTRKHEKKQEFLEVRDGHYPHRSIVHPGPRHMPRDFVRNYSHPMNVGFSRQHVMQGNLINDPRITIEYSSNENPFQPAQTMGHNRPMLASNVSQRLPSYGPDIPTRPLSMQGRFHHIQLRDTSPHNVMGGPNWKQVSPTPWVLSSPSGEQKPASIFVIPNLDVFHSSQLQRETKRSRIDGVNDSSYPHKRTGDRGHGLGAFGSNVPSGPVIVSQENNSVSRGQHHSGHDFIWRGIIAKTGTSVCHAICVPVGETIKSEIPDVVNCYARTGLDRLTEHYANTAVGFSIVFFLPDAETDHASYTEFLRKLITKERAGVAKLLDGTNMFLVPPSDFITKVLKVDGPACLYGVVLKSAPSGTSLPPESIQRQHADAPELTPSQLARAREFLSSDIIDSLMKISAMEGTTGASAGMPASDVGR